MQWDEMWDKLGKGKYGPVIRQKVLGQYFDEKIKFCHKIGKVTKDESDLVLISHKYRNELYHTGIKYDELIYPLAWVYHDLACNFFERFRRGFVRYGSDDKFTDVVTRHLGEIKGAFGNIDDQIMMAAKSLRDIKPPLKTPFSDVISQFAINKIEAIQADIEFLVKDNPRQFSEKEILEEIQFHDFFIGIDSPFRDELAKCSSSVEMMTISENARQTWKPKHRNNPTARWIKRAVKLRQEKSVVDVMRKFEQLRQEAALLERIANEAAIQLDGWIQHQIDVARGK
jgi:hypothetical protein